MMVVCEYFSDKWESERKTVNDFISDFRQSVKKIANQNLNLGTQQFRFFNTPMGCTNS